jgi:hypothetical protein
MHLTSEQEKIMQRLTPYAGQRVLVITSQYVSDIAQEALNIAIGIGFNANALRGLQKKEIIKVEPIWKGAWVTVLKTC